MSIYAKSINDAYWISSNYLETANKFEVYNLTSDPESPVFVAQSLKLIFTSFIQFQLHFSSIFLGHGEQRSKNGSQQRRRTLTDLWHQLASTINVNKKIKLHFDKLNFIF